MSSGQLAILLVAVAIGGVVKSITGMGLPLIAIPLAAPFVSTPVAVAVISLPNLVHNGVLAFQHRRDLTDHEALLRFCAAGIVGALAGAVALTVVAEEVLQAGIVLTVAAFVVNALRHPDQRLSARQERRWNLPVGFAGGVFQGAVGISGPVVGAWYLARGFAGASFIVTVTTVFAATGATQAVVLVADGQLDGRWGVALAVFVVATATLPVGAWVRDRIPAERFRHAVLIVLVISAASVAYDLATSIL